MKNTYLKTIDTVRERERESLTLKNNKRNEVII